jgi:hypothetical protein
MTTEPLSILTVRSLSLSIHANRVTLSARTAETDKLCSREPLWRSLALNLGAWERRTGRDVGLRDAQVRRQVKPHATPRQNLRGQEGIIS